MKKIKELVNSSKFKRGMEIFLRVGGVILIIELIAYLLGVIEISKLSICFSQLFMIWFAFGAKIKSENPIEE